MRIIPVLDLARGKAVHAAGGDRSRYEPVRSALAPGSVGDPIALLRAFRRHFGQDEIYLADLDAIQGGSLQRAIIGELAAIPGPLVVDAGSHLPGATRDLLSCGASRAVIGLETLRSFEDLAAIAGAVGADRVVFSLDLRMGEPLLHPVLRAGSGTSQRTTTGLAEQALAAGVRHLLVLDLARMGGGGGVDLGLVAELRRRFPGEQLWAGGGVRSRADLERMRDAGCDGALVASAIHAGRVTAADLAPLAGPAVQSPASTSR
jgi:phosphoribosylformimino-5-aminoimidazole carboxamide ribotide isomerase